MGCSSSAPVDEPAPFTTDIVPMVENPLFSMSLPNPMNETLAARPAADATHSKTVADRITSVSDAEVSFERPPSPGDVGPEPDPRMLRMKCNGLIARAYRRHGINSDPNQFPAPTSPTQKVTAAMCESWLANLHVSLPVSSRAPSVAASEYIATPASTAPLESFSRRVDSISFAPSTPLDDSRLESNPPSPAPGSHLLKSRGFSATGSLRRSVA
jgi:hypothetical protein